MLLILLKMANSRKKTYTLLFVFCFFYIGSRKERKKNTVEIKCRPLNTKKRKKKKKEKKKEKRNIFDNVKP